MNLDLWLYHMTFLGLLLLLVQSLNLTWKTRLFSLGHHGFFGLGAYAAAVATKLALPTETTRTLEGAGDRLAGLGLLTVCILAGAAGAAVAALLTWRLFARIRGDYFAVATLVFAEIVRSVAANWDYVGGGLGFEAPYLVFSKTSGERLLYSAFYAAVLLGLNLAAFAAIRRIERSVYGLYIAAVEDNPLAAELSGINVTRLQGLVFVLAATAAGVAGALFLHFTTLIVPGDFSLLNGLPAILGVVLGGLSSMRCVIAATFIYIAYEVIKLRFFGLFGPEYGVLIAEWKEALMGLILILSVILPTVWRRTRMRRVGMSRQAWALKEIGERGGSVSGE